MDKKMKFLYMSDLHLEFGHLRIDIEDTQDVDAILLAGDIDVSDHAVDWFMKQPGLKNKQICYIAGNHEFYMTKKRYSLDGVKTKIRESLKFHGLDNVHFLDNEVFRIPETNVSVLGSTLWTNFKLHGNEILELLRAKTYMNDYRQIKVENRLLTPEDTQKFHYEAVAFLNENITKEKSEGRTVVVMTHHAPSILSVQEEFKSNSAAYATEVIHSYPNMPLPDVWVHGHIHKSSDYMLDNCRVLANPRGYVRYELNKDFGMKTFEILCG